VLANRLSESGKHTVLLIEAGGDDRPFHNLGQFVANQLVRVPVGFAANVHDPKLTWGYQSEPEPEAGDRRFDVIRGRILGGSSAINGLLYVRGESADYDRWRQAGCTGWGWDDLLPYFRRAENQEAGEDSWQGVGGPLNVSEGPIFPIAEKVLDAAEAMGLPRSSSFNRGVQFGGGKTQHTIRKGRRDSSAAAYLDPARARPNLRIVTETLVSKVVFEGKRVVGVAFMRRGEEGEYRARKEVILAGGAINSPQLLELSGIGGGRRLNDLGLPVVANSPGVGENLQDHYYAAISWRLRPNVASLNNLTRFPRILIEAAKYAVSRRGLLAQSTLQIFIYAKSAPHLETADLQLSFVPASMQKPDPGQRMMKADGHPGMTLCSCHLRPASRGYVRARTSDIRDQPAISFGYLEHPEDRRAQIAGLRLGRALGAHPVLEPYIDHESLPGAEAAGDADLLAYIREAGGTVYHPVGTVRMGADASSPLDPRLRVRGVEGLRVADASVMPFLISGNTNAPTIMIAEKASDMILRDAA
jgi:choline dehydrogenase